MDPVDKALVEYLLADQPAQIVLIGQALQEVNWPAVSGATSPRVLRFDSLEHYSALDGREHERREEPHENHQIDSASASGARVALVSLDGPDFSPTSIELEQVLGQAVRLFPEQLLACTCASEPADTTFYAFGFRRLVLGDSGSMRLFAYSLSNYKQPPDWLNARFWANPERLEQTEEPDIYGEENGFDEEE